MRSPERAIAKARERPDAVRQAIDTVWSEGVAGAYLRVMHRLDQLAPLGYGAAGVVTGVGNGVSKYWVVACDPVVERSDLAGLPGAYQWPTCRASRAGCAVCRMRSRQTFGCGRWTCVLWPSAALIQMVTFRTVFPGGRRS